MLRKLAAALENFDEVGGFPAEFEGDKGVTYEGPNGKLAEHAEFVHELVQGELEQGWVTLCTEAPRGPYRTSPIFVIPKKTGGKPNGKWRFIHHLSWAPPGIGSVNEGCPMDGAGFWRIEYENVDDLCSKVERLKRPGKQVMLYKVDLDAAYKQWPLEQSHVHRMGFRWLDVRKPIPEGIASGGREPRDDELVWYFVSRLPFGWTRSVSWFHAVSRALKELHLWEQTPGVATQVPRAVHDTSTYVDDTGGAAITAAWARASKARFHEVCARYGVPVSAKKELLEGAIDTTKEFLGIVIDVVKGERRLSEERVAEGLRRLKELDGKAYVATSELRSLVGVLSFAAQCCPHARTFLRRCWDALADARGRWIRLGRGIQADLAFWKGLWRDYNGVHLTPELGWRLCEDLGIFTDASLEGWGAFYNGEWCGGKWPASARGLHINELELLTLAIAGHTWGSEWARRRLITNCDNMASVYTVNKGAARDPAMMVAMRELFLAASKHGFELRARWLGTKENVAADAISRGDLKRFFEYASTELGFDVRALRQHDGPAALAALRTALERLRNARYAHSTATTTEPKLVPWFQFKYWMSRWGCPVHEIPTFDECELYVAFLEEFYDAQKGGQEHRLKGTVVEGYVAALVRDMKMRHRGLNLRDVCPTLGHLTGGAKRLGAERGEVVEGGLPLTSGEMQLVVRTLINESRAESSKGNRDRAWNAMVAACVVLTSFVFLMRVCEAVQTQGNRASSVAGLYWEHVKLLDRAHNPVPPTALLRPGGVASVRYVEIEWWKTKMDPLARGRRNAHHASDLPICVVRFLSSLAQRVLRSEVAAHTRAGEPQPEAAATDTFLRRHVFTTYDGKPFQDYAYSRMFRRITGDLEFPLEKRRPHKGLRGGGRSAMGAAGISRAGRDAAGGWKQNSVTGQLVYDTFQRGQVNDVQRSMLTAPQEASQQMYRC